MLGRSKPVDVDGGVREPETLAHVVARLGVGGGRAGHDRDAGEQAAQLPELDVLRAEVVAPLTDAVGLVDGEQGHAGGADSCAASAVRPCSRSRKPSVISVSGATYRRSSSPACRRAQDAARLAGSSDEL